MSTPQLICIMGAESTGKTTLAAALAAHFGCPWVPECLRTFCDVHQRTPRQDEQALILETQFAHQQAALATAQLGGIARYVFSDTAPLTTAIYSECVFADRSLYERAAALHTRYALTLLCAPDLGWQADGIQRDSPDAQKRVHAMMERELARLAVPVSRVVGNGSARLAAAMRFIGDL